MNKQNQIILLGQAQQLFDANLNPITQSGTFKYLILKDPASGVLQIMLFLVNRPFEFHAEGLQSYMNQNNLREITLNGGGKVVISASDKLKIMTFHDKSYAFGQPCPAEVVSLAKELWPEFEIDSSRINSYAKEEMSIAGETFTYGQVKYEADHP
jgi:hypothetical protein